MLSTGTITHAVSEIVAALNRGLISNYALPAYSNYKLLFGSPEVQRKVYTLGPVGERT